MSTLQAQALFCSDLQPSTYPNGSVVRCTVGDTLTQLTADGCAARLAQESGDHPEAAAERMTWALFTVAWAFDPICI